MVDEVPSSAEKRRRLRERLNAGGLIVAPGIFDGISARFADAASFDALYMTGYGISASHLALPDAGFATLTDMVDRVRCLADHTRAPLIADADTGYGGALNVRHTVRAYEAAGAAAVQIEDQEFPKKCGHVLGRRVIPAEDMITKIKVAADNRRDANLLIIARTDARTNLGLDEALHRAAAYAEAGADVLFVESPESEDEMVRICTELAKPCLANMVEGGRTPVLDQDRLAAIGYRVAIYPATGFLAVGTALSAAYASLKKPGSTDVDLYRFEAFSRMMGFEDVWDFDAKYGSEDS